MSLWASRLGDIQFNVISGTPQTFRRTKSHLHHAGIDQVVLLQQLTGKAFYTQDGRDVMLGPGNVACYDSARPVQKIFASNSSVLAIQIPKTLMLNAVGPTERYTVRELSQNTEVGRLMVSFLRDLPPVLSKVSGAQAEQLSQCAVGLIMATLAEPASVKLEHSDWERSTLGLQARQAIHARFRDARLAPDTIAAQLNISVRYLQKLFRTAHTTPSEYIWECRLESSRKELETPHLASLSIHDIALRNGFSELGHFGRRFRERYGVSPRQYRSMRQKQAAATPVPHLFLPH